MATDGTSGRHGSGKKYWYVKYDDYKTGTDITALQDQTDCIGSGDESDVSAAETFLNIVKHMIFFQSLSVQWDHRADPKEIPKKGML